MGIYIRIVLGIVSSIPIGLLIYSLLNGETALPKEATTAAGETALHLASQGGWGIVVDQLLQAGAAAVTAASETALHLAAHTGNEFVVGPLLQAGAEAVTVASETALHLAAQSGFLFVAGQLLEAGAEAGCFALGRC